MIAGLPLLVPDDVTDFQSSAEAVAQLLERRVFNVVRLFASKLRDPTLSKPAVLQQLRETFLKVPVAGLALFAYIGHMSTGFLTYAEEVQRQSEGIAIEKGKPSCNMHDSSSESNKNDCGNTLSFIQGTFNAAGRVRYTQLTVRSVFRMYCMCGQTA